MRIIYKEKVFEYKGLFRKTTMYFEFDYDFIENEKYVVIISIISKGKQILKEKDSFCYRTNDWLINNNYFRIKNNYEFESNEIKKVISLNYKNYKKYCYSINPLAIYRKENNDCVILYFNNNIYKVKGIASEIISNIYNKKSFKEYIDKYEKLSIINTLISKDCVICYE